MRESRNQEDVIQNGAERSEESSIHTGLDSSLRSE